MQVGEFVFVDVDEFDFVDAVDDVDFDVVDIVVDVGVVLVGDGVVTKLKLSSAQKNILPSKDCALPKPFKLKSN